MRILIALWAMAFIVVSMAYESWFLIATGVTVFAVALWAVIGVFRQTRQYSYRHFYKRERKAMESARREIDELYWRASAQYSNSPWPPPRGPGGRYNYL
jgi:hypothetical protein